MWNEPDNEVFWTGTREQFFRVYETAARALEDELGDAVVVGGPSTTKPRAAWLEGLLRHCRARGCRVSFLSFHANLAADAPIPALEGDLRSGARARAALPRPLADRVEVNESIGPADQYRPGEILGFLEHMEAGGADAAARSCWLDLAGADNCSNGTLEGLLTPDGPAAQRLVGLPRLRRGRGRHGCRAAPTPPPWRCSPAGGPSPAAHRCCWPATTAPTRRRRPLSVELTLRGLAGALPGARRAVADARSCSRTRASSRSPRRPWWPGAPSRWRRRRDAAGGRARPPPGAGRHAWRVRRRLSRRPRRSPRSTRR